MSKISFLSKNFHLAISSAAVVPAALMYGVAPQAVVPQVFDISVSTPDLANVFRVIMCLYLTVAAVWIFGMLKQEHWRMATVTNLIFMGSISVGRLLSMLLDGLPSSVLITAWLVELVLTALPVFQLWRFRGEQ